MVLKALTHLLLMLPVDEVESFLSLPYARTLAQQILSVNDKNG
jgi:hypothetical protein